MDSSSESTSTATVPPSPARLEAERVKREKGVKHSIKFVQYLGRTTPIVLQNDNGPCPLIAICNALSLKKSLGLGLNNSEVSQDQLLSLVYDRMMHSNPGTYKDIEEMLCLLHRLTTGINVNIKFRRIDDFELTPECAIFGLLDIPLYHGWIVDPQDKETYAAIGSESYDILAPESLETKSEQKKKLEDDNVDFAAATITSAPVLASPSPSRDHSFDDSRHRDRKGDIEEEAELLKALELSEADLGTHLGTSEEDFTEESEETGSPISSDCADIYEDAEESILDSITVDSENREPVYEGEIIENFMKNSASQLTVYGLFCLLDNVKEGEICVFFRNNRFNTMVKYEGELYILATDQGFIHEPDLVWEKLNEVDGNTVYTTGNFKEFKMSDRSNCTWDAENAMVDTADYPSTIGSAEESSSFDSDLQLAIALQKQEYGDQQQPHSNLQPPAFTDDSSSFVTVPPVSESSDECTKSSKPKEM